MDAKGRELEKYKVPYGAFLYATDGDEVKKGQTHRQVGPAPHPDPRGEGRRGEVRGHRREGDLPPRGRRPGPASPRHHRAQGRPAPADQHRRRPGQHPGLPLPARPGTPGGRGRPADQGRPHARPPAPRLGRQPGHRRWSAPRHGDLRGPQAQGPGRHGRDLGPRRDLLRQAQGQDDHPRRLRGRHREGPPRPQRTSSCWSTPATTSRPAIPSPKARWFRTTSCGSRARRPCGRTCSTRSRTCTARRAWTSTTSTSS